MDDRVESSTEAMAANMAMEARAGKGKADGEDLPLVTFALFAYNQEKYIREAVEAALAQDYPNLEIILSDDCSTDRTFEVIQNIVSKYKGRHRVIHNRNQSNLGISRHLNMAFSMVSGDFVAPVNTTSATFSVSVNSMICCLVSLITSEAFPASA